MLDLNRLSRSNGLLVAKGLCTLVDAIVGLSAATAVANAWEAEAVAVFLAVHFSRCYRGYERSDCSCQSMESEGNGDVTGMNHHWLLR